MAALKFFARSIITFNNNLHSCHSTKQLLSLTGYQVSKRWGSFRDSPQYKDTIKYTDYKVTKDPEEWKWVQFYLPPERVPDAPKDVTEAFPSGWKSSREEAKRNPYFIARTRNHMLPVYLHRTQRGMRRLSVIRRISGDVIALEADLRKYLEEVTRTEMGSQILEPCGIIKFRGDVVSRIKEWMIMKGF